MGVTSASAPTAVTATPLFVEDRAGQSPAEEKTAESLVDTQQEPEEHDHSLSDDEWRVAIDLGGFLEPAIFIARRKGDDETGIDELGDSEYEPFLLDKISYDSRMRDAAERRRRNPRALQLYDVPSDIQNDQVPDDLAHYR